MQGLPDDEGTVPKFQGFLFAVESAMSSPMYDPSSLGTLQVTPGDAMVMFSGRCKNAVKATSSLPKEKIEV